MRLSTFLLILAAGLLLISCKTSKNPVSAPEVQPAFKPLAQLPFPGKGASDVWGYFDNSSGREFAIVGFLGGGVSIVEVTDPANPRQVASIDTIPGFDVKVYRHWLYTVNGGRNGDGAIVDIADPDNPVVVGAFPSSHNIFITADGYMVAEAARPPLIIYDIHTDPLHPAVIWSGGTEGHDAAVIGTRLFDFHGRAGTNIYDISNIANPQLLVSIQDQTIRYNHSGWTSKDGGYLYICDELALAPAPDIIIYDIRDIANPVRVGEYGDPTATVHNLYVIGDYAYVSYYTAGFRIFDVSDPTRLVEVAHFDTSPGTGEGFLPGQPLGDFGVYPFSPSGTIYVSDTENVSDTESWLFLFRFDGLK